MTSELQPDDFPLQVVDRALFLASGRFLVALDSAALAADVAARLNAGEAWRLGLDVPAISQEPRPADDEPGWSLLTARSTDRNVPEPPPIETPK